MKSVEPIIIRICFPFLTRNQAPSLFMCRITVKQPSADFLDLRNSRPSMIALGSNTRQNHVCIDFCLLLRYLISRRPLKPNNLLLLLICKHHILLQLNGWVLEFICQLYLGCFGLQGYFLVLFLQLMDTWIYIKHWHAFVIALKLGLHAVLWLVFVLLGFRWEAGFRLATADVIWWF